MADVRVYIDGTDGGDWRMTLDSLLHVSYHLRGSITMGIPEHMIQSGCTHLLYVIAPGVDYEDMLQEIYWRAQNKEDKIMIVAYIAIDNNSMFTLLQQQQIESMLDDIRMLDVMVVESLEEAAAKLNALVLGYWRL